MKQKASDKVSYYLPVIEAKRNDIYFALFDEAENEILKTNFTEVNEAFENSLQSFGEIAIGGNAMEKCKSIFHEKKYQFISDIKFSSESMIQLSERKFRQHQFEDLAYFEPEYFHAFTPKMAKQ